MMKKIKLTIFITVLLLSCSENNDIEIDIKAIEFNKLYQADGLKPIPINYLLLINNKSNSKVFVKDFSVNLFLFNKKVKSDIVFNQEVIKPNEIIKLKINILDNVIYGQSLMELYENNQHFIGNDYFINVVNSKKGINKSLSNSIDLIKNFYLDYNKIEFEDSIRMNLGYKVPQILR